MSGWIEVGDGAWYRREEPWDVNVGVIRGADGLCVVDTRGSHRQARELVEALRELGGPVRAVVNSHWHFDHTWGNRVLRDEGAQLWGHATLPATMRRWFDDVRESLSFADPDLAEELAEVEVAPPDELVDPVAIIDLGDRGVEARFLGRGHTDGDVVVTSPDADVVFAGDLVEQSGPPAYGDDSHPLAWPATADRLVGRLGPAARVVPGHGVAVDRAFCASQRDGIAAVAGLCRELHGAGVSVRDALDEGGDRWPFPTERLREAVLLAWRELDTPTA